VFGTKDRRDYAVVASGGFFTIGKDSFVVPIRFLSITQERDSFFLRISEAAVKAVPLMPDQNYEWHSDEAWLALNDSHFENPGSESALCLAFSGCSPTGLQGVEEVANWREVLRDARFSRASG
jgi:hypothetical protein